jgi:hypothetical protein
MNHLFSRSLSKVLIRNRFTKPVTIEGETGGEMIKISVNDKMVYNGKFRDIGMVIGLRVRFSGKGIIYRFDCEAY